ncbi:protein GAST1-like [Typha angustifolia]|uniref:protein GAST1-like n=1 Tax=Typha angustifolia TaxID=59011 RepID=UPI003C2F9248
MEGKARVIVLCLVLLLLFSRGGQANYSQAPSAQPGNSSRGPTPQPIRFPMYGVTQGSLHPQECPGRCATRCSATAYKKPCMFFCKKCCSKCLCVPPGTYGNKQFCPCYNDWKTKRGGPKCP